MFETETVAPFLVRKVNWGGTVPLAPPVATPLNSNCRLVDLEIALDNSNDNNNNTKIKNNRKSSNSLKDIAQRKLGQKGKPFWFTNYNLKTKKQINSKLYMITPWSLLLKPQKSHKQNLNHFHGHETIPSCVAVFHFPR